MQLPIYTVSILWACMHPRPSPWSVEAVRSCSSHSLLCAHWRMSSSTVPPPTSLSTVTSLHACMGGIQNEWDTINMQGCAHNCLSGGYFQSQFNTQTCLLYSLTCGKLGLRVVVCLSSTDHHHQPVWTYMSLNMYINSFRENTLTEHE